MTRTTRIRTGGRVLASLAFAALVTAWPDARLHAQSLEATAADSVRAVEEDATVEPVPHNPPARAEMKVRLDVSSRNVVRSGPGDSFSIVGIFEKGAEFAVVAKSGPWYNIRISDTKTGWIHSSLCKTYEDMSDLEFQPNPRLYSRVGSYVLTAYAGAYSFDRKSNSLALGGRLGYYVFDMLQAEASVSWTRVQRPAEIVENLFGLTLEAEDFHMLYYNLNLTLEVLPGRQMVPYVTGGVGSAIMQGETETSLNYGAGTLLYITKKTSIRWEVRGYRFGSGPDDARVTNDNIEFSMGTSLLF